MNQTEPSHDEQTYMLESLIRGRNEEFRANIRKHQLDFLKMERREGRPSEWYNDLYIGSISLEENNGQNGVITSRILDSQCDEACAALINCMRHGEVNESCGILAGLVAMKDKILYWQKRDNPMVPYFEWWISALHSSGLSTVLLDLLGKAKGGQAEIRSYCLNLIAILTMTATTIYVEKMLAERVIEIMFNCLKRQPTTLELLDIIAILSNILCDQSQMEAVSKRMLDLGIIKYIKTICRKPVLSQLRRSAHWLASHLMSTEIAKFSDNDLKELFEICQLNLQALITAKLDGDLPLGVYLQSFRDGKPNEDDFLFSCTMEEIKSLHWVLFSIKRAADYSPTLARQIRPLDVVAILWQSDTELQWRALRLLCVMVADSLRMSLSFIDLGGSLALVRLTKSNNIKIHETISILLTNLAQYKNIRLQSALLQFLDQEIEKIKQGTQNCGCLYSARFLSNLLHQPKSQILWKLIDKFATFEAIAIILSPNGLYECDIQNSLIDALETVFSTLSEPDTQKQFIMILEQVSIIECLCTLATRLTGEPAIRFLNIIESFSQ